MPVADFDILIDWDNDGGVNLTNFETGSAEGWLAGGAPAPVLSNSTAHYQSGTQSLLVEWAVDEPPDTLPFEFDNSATGFDEGEFGEANPPIEVPFVSPYIERTISGLIVGREYTLSAWIYVPSSSRDVRFSVVGVSNGSYSTTVDALVELTHTFTATSDAHIIRINPETDPSTGLEKFWLDTVMITSDGEEVSGDVLGTRTGLQFRRGRDTPRALEAISPAECTFELNNDPASGQKYSPNNTGSPYYSFLKPGRAIFVRATWEGTTYPLFYGYLDDFQLNAAPEDQSATFSALDMLGKLAAFELSTPVYPSLTSGETLHVILDELGWPQERRSIDQGATTIKWWSEEATDALEAVKKVVDSEGIPSFAYIDPQGNFIFRDRHHRVTSERSLMSQATFNSGAFGSEEEPQFAPPMEYNIGWPDLINKAEFQVEGRMPTTLQPVFEMDAEETIWLQQDTPYILDVEGGDPFISAVTPVPGVVGLSTEDEAEELRVPADADFIVLTAGVTVDAELSRDSGQTTQVILTARSGNAVIKGLRLRAYPIEVTHTVKVRVENAVSVAEHGPRTFDGELPWANGYDAEAIANLIVGQRAERLPTVEFTVNNGNDIRYEQMLSRQLSDRITLQEAQTFTDHDFYIEFIEHNIDDVGYNHTVVFGCEQARDLEEANSFRFGDTNAGFDEGVFAGEGFTDPGNVFILDQSNLDEKNVVF